MLRYLRGDATAPISRPAIVAHITNNMGAWGAGFVLAVSKRWPAAEQRYLSTARHYLGVTTFVQVEPGVAVANMCAQHGVGTGVRRVVDAALAQCLGDVAKLAAKMGATIHMPRIGCGLAGAKWDEIEPIVTEMCGDVDVYIYDP